MAIVQVEGSRVERESSSRMMDYNAPLNSCTFGKARREFWLSSGLRNISTQLKT